MFQGSLAALVTPFDGQGDIDYACLGKLLDFHLGQGTDGLVVAGTTGESATLSSDEFSGLIDVILKQVDGRIPVVAGTGSASTSRAIEQTRLAARLGADAALVVTPYYNRPVQQGLEAHFLAVADSADIPLLLYNVPSRTAVDLLPETVERLASHDRIVGIKEAVGQAGRIDELIAHCGDSFSVLSGDDHSCHEAMKHGAVGVISVAANVVPGKMHALCAAALRGDWPGSESLDGELRELFDILMIETNPIPVKWCLHEMGLIGPDLRLPMTKLATECREEVRQSLVKLRIIQS
jgi:4-hydroxy-tetrahydrodipicolinate synthase